MSININWNSLEQESLLSWSKGLLNNALNSGKRPSILASQIEIKDLHFGHNAPVVEILEIGELDDDKFRGIFKVKYAGDSHINLGTKIQANPMNIFTTNSVNKYNYDFTLPDLSMVNQSFKIPIDVRLSEISLSCIVIVVFNKTKGLTLVFKNDPLENIHVSSTFDSIPAIRNFLQNQIEKQIRELFREILPNVLYKISLKWTNNLRSQLIAHNATTNNNSKLEPNRNVILFMDINPDGPDFAAGNLLRLSTLCASRQSLSLSTPKIKGFIQRSTMERFFNENVLGTQRNNFFFFNNNKYSNALPIELFTGTASDTLKSNPDNEILNSTAVGASNLVANEDIDFEKIQKNLVDVSKYQTMSYNNSVKNKTTGVKRPKRRVIHFGSKKKEGSTNIKVPMENNSDRLKQQASVADHHYNNNSNMHIHERAAVNSLNQNGKNYVEDNQSDTSESTLVNSKDVESELSHNNSLAEECSYIDDNSTAFDDKLDKKCISDDEIDGVGEGEHKLRDKRALSSSSVSVEYLRSLYVQEQQRSSKIKKAIESSLKRNIMEKITAKKNNTEDNCNNNIRIQTTSVDHEKKAASAKGATPGKSLNEIILNTQGLQKSNNLKNRLHYMGITAKKPLIVNTDKNTTGTAITKEELRMLASPTYHKKVTNSDIDFKSPTSGVTGSPTGMDFFTPNVLVNLSDIPPPYVP